MRRFYLGLMLLYLICLGDLLKIKAMMKYVVLGGKYDLFSNYSFCVIYGSSELHA